MNIGFDAKRAYHNNTGLGNYSRTLINGLAKGFPQHHYYLFNPKSSSRFVSSFDWVHEYLPRTTLSKTFPSLWRSAWLVNDLKKLQIDLFHGLSHEIPTGIHKSGIPSVVTIHDLIFERYPEQFNPIDVQIYRRKFRYACVHADRIIAISKQTRDDIINLYKIDPAKIDICYQSCNPTFAATVSNVEKEVIKKRYELPDQFFLTVGSIIERKNLLNICKALTILKGKLDIPIVVIGEGKKYKTLVKEYINFAQLNDHVIFLSERESVKNDPEFRSAKSFPAIYQLSKAMIYPSTFEGFGIPVLEALFSKIPVITSNVSCLPEAGGDGALYVNPYKPEEIADAMLSIINDANLVNQKIQKGLVHAQQFTIEKTSAEVMHVYQKTLGASLM